MLFSLIGQLAIEVDWLKKNLQKLPPEERKPLVEKENEVLSITRQTGMLDIGRTSVYPRVRKGITLETLVLMRLIDRHHTDEPTWGYRMITSHLRDQHDCHCIGQQADDSQQTKSVQQWPLHVSFTAFSILSHNTTGPLSMQQKLVHVW
jgi:hypothetical protein